MKTFLLIIGCLVILVLFGLVAFMVCGGFLALSNIDLDQDSDEDIIFKYDHQWNKHE